MKPELIEDIELELRLLRDLLGECEPLIQAVAGKSPGKTEKLAAASMLQSFYNSIENVFDRVAAGVDRQSPQGPDRHEKLLTQIAEPGASRPAVISPELHDGLKRYLEFRNSYRYAHFFRLDWATMAALVAQCGSTLERLEAEVAAFVRGQGGRRLFAGEGQGELPPYWFAEPRPIPAARKPMLALPCALAAIVGLLTGLLASSAADYLRTRLHARSSLSAADFRKLAAQQGRHLAAYADVPEVRQALGVLGFFETGDWEFAPPEDRQTFSGTVRGYSASLPASARLTFERGRLQKIELDVAEDQYVFSLAAGRVARVAHLRRQTGLPLSVVELDGRGEVRYLGTWTARGEAALPAEGADGPPPPGRRDRFFRTGRALLEARSADQGPLESVTLRTAPGATTTYAATPAGGILAPTPNAPTTLHDLPPTTQARPPAPS